MKRSARPASPAQHTGAPPTTTATPRFKPGDTVRVRSASPPGHVRTPFYCRGRTGTIERVCGRFGNPEELAYGRPGLPAIPLYRVRFSSRELWGDEAERALDAVEIEIFEHWLERPDERPSAADRNG